MDECPHCGGAMENRGVMFELGRTVWGCIECNREYRVNEDGSFLRIGDWDDPEEGPNENNFKRA